MMPRFPVEIRLRRGCHRGQWERRGRPSLSRRVSRVVGRDRVLTEPLIGPALEGVPPTEHV